jgi:hypothetical protein
MTEEKKALPIALLQPLVSRVRTDVHWKKAKGSPPFMVKVPLTDEYLNVHMTGGIARGVCPIKAGESTTRVAVLDLDSHKGEMEWSDMIFEADRISKSLADAGVRAVPFCSSGGKGLHLYMLWDEPQDCYSIRSFLRAMLSDYGFTDGDGGVSNNQIEIFPKQDSVPVDGFGNMFILPYSGESCPLEPLMDYQRMPKEYPVEWPVSAPVPVVQKPERVERGEPHGLDARLVEAVSALSSDVPYGQWLKIGQALHHETEGSPDGLLLWDKWSSTGADYPGFEELEHKWDSFGRSSAQPVTAGTIYKMATDAGWIDAPSADDFDIVQPEPEPVANSSRFAIQNALSFAAGKPVKYIIKGVLPEADLAVFYGETASGKSFFTLDMVCAVARGVPWRGRRVTQGRVLYIIAEGSGGFKNRINAYVSRHGLTELDLDVISAAPNFLEKKDIADLMAAIKEMGQYSLIVVDTWAQVTPGSNENSGEDMGKALAHCRKLRHASGAMVVLVHHSGKDATRGARGWSGLRAAADCEISVERDGDVRTATITKLKDGDDGSRFGFSLSTVPVGHDDDGDPVTSCVVEEAEVSASTNLTNSSKKTKIGENERVLMDSVQDIFDRDNEWPSVDFLVTEAMERLPESNTRTAVRRVNLKKCLDKMVDKELLVIENGFVSCPDL